MRRLLLLSPLLFALPLGCAQDNPGTPPPGQGEVGYGFYFPTGIAFVPDANGGPGFVYVVSSDFDLRFNRGTLSSVNLATLDLPDAGATPVAIEDPHIARQVAIDVFGGPVAVFQRANRPVNERRIFIAGRQNDTLDVVDVDGETLRCADESAGADCAATAISLAGSIVDAYRPVVAGGDVFVAGLTPLDNPVGTDTNQVSMVARVHAEDLSGLTFHALGPAASVLGAEAVDGMVQVDGLIYLAGRASGGLDENQGQLIFNEAPLRTLSLASFDDAAVPSTYVPLDAQVRIRDTRAIARSSDGSRLYLVTRNPDALAILDISPDLDGKPRNQVVGVADLPSGATELAVIPRGPGRRDLVAVTCSTASVVAVYDDEIGRVVAALRGVGDQPFGVAVGPRVIAGSATPGGARLYTTAFGRGDLAVVDLPNLDDLSTAAVLATFGPNQNCLNDNPDARPPECPNP